MKWRFALLIGFISPAVASAIDVEGVLPAALDQPRVYLAISVDAKSPPLAAKGESTAAAIAQLMGERDRGNGQTFAIEAFLDTGASGVMLSKATADGLGIRPVATSGGKPVQFFDVGIGGPEAFGVSPPLFLRISDYSGNTDGDSLERYTRAAGPIRLAMRPHVGMIDRLSGGVDVAGMPVMANRVVVIDVRPVAKLDKLRTSLLPRGDRNVPRVDVKVPMSYVDFARFTRVEPAGAAGPGTAPHPMVGPHPFDGAARTPPITLRHGSKSASATMLLDTGAAASMLSAKKARELGITVAESGELTNIPADRQFSLPIGGVGGARTIHGCYIDVIQLPTIAGDPVRYLKAPMLIQDITVTDVNTKQTYTLDGVLGMNLFVPSATLDGTGLNRGVDEIHDAAFDHIVIDHPNRTLGLDLR
jgi:hypothetical protein